MNRLFLLLILLQSTAHAAMVVSSLPERHTVVLRLTKEEAKGLKKGAQALVFEGEAQKTTDSYRVEILSIDGLDTAFAVAHPPPAWPVGTLLTLKPLPPGQTPVEIKRAPTRGVRGIGAVPLSQHQLVEFLYLASKDPYVKMLGDFLFRQRKFQAPDSKVKSEASGFGIEASLALPHPPISLHFQGRSSNLSGEATSGHYYESHTRIRAILGVQVDQHHFISTGITDERLRTPFGTFHIPRRHYSLLYFTEAAEFGFTTRPQQSVRALNSKSDLSDGILQVPVKELPSEFTIYAGRPLSADSTLRGTLTLYERRKFNRPSNNNGYRNHWGWIVGVVHKLDQQAWLEGTVDWRSRGWVDPAALSIQTLEHWHLSGAYMVKFGWQAHVGGGFSIRRASADWQGDTNHVSDDTMQINLAAMLQL